jgi:gliding motility-associated-like protein
MHSDTSRTIFLQVSAKNNFTNILTWNDYEGWTWSFVKAYNIFRGIDGMMDPIPIATIPYGTFNYTDEVGMYTPTQGKFKYYIEAQQGPGMPDFRDTSFSNIGNDIQNSMIFIPNAFSPKGYNSVFRPVSIFVDRSSYVFVIWNRWGEELFRTNDPAEGWDGKHKDEFVPVGTYIYYVKFITSEGEVFEKRSSVTVIK